MIELTPATVEDAPIIAKILNKALERKAGYGDSEWGTDPFTYKEVEGDIANGEFYIVTIGEKLAGAVRLTKSDENMWDKKGVDDGSSLYIHRLVTLPEFKGQGIGEQVIEWIVDKAKQDGRHLLRLDCGYKNASLCNYYHRTGFEEVARNDFVSNSGSVYKAALFQRDIS